MTTDKKSNDSEESNDGEKSNNDENSNDKKSNMNDFQIEIKADD